MRSQFIWSGKKEVLSVTTVTRWTQDVGYSRNPGVGVRDSGEALYRGGRSGVQREWWPYRWMAVPMDGDELYRGGWSAVQREWWLYRWMAVPTDGGPCRWVASSGERHRWMVGHAGCPAQVRG